MTLPPALIAEVDVFAVAISEQNGTKISRASAVEILIRSALNVRRNAKTR